MSHSGHTQLYTLTGIEVVGLGHLHSRIGVLLQLSYRLTTLANDGSRSDGRHQYLEVVTLAIASACNETQVRLGRMGGLATTGRHSLNVNNTLIRTHSLAIDWLISSKIQSKLTLR